MIDMRQVGLRLRRGLAAGGVPAAALLACSCVSGMAYRAPVIPPAGGFFSNTSAPLDVDVQGTRLGEKTGESSAASILGLVAWGDASIDAAARAGDIQVIQHADHRYFSLLGPLFQRYTTVVYGD